MISTTRNKKILKFAVAVVFWIGIWWILAAVINNEFVVPSPLTVAGHLGTLVREKAFWAKTGMSLLRVLSGFLLGVTVGLLLSAAGAVSEYAEAIIAPFIRIIRSTPVTSFVILIMLWVGYDFVPVIIASLLVAPVIYANVREGILKTPHELLEVTKMYRFSAVKKLRLLYIPSVKPYFVSAVLTSLGLAWKSGIAAEVLSLPETAIGREIYYSKIYLETADLFAWTIVIILFSYLIEKAFNGVVKERKKTVITDAHEKEHFEEASDSEDFVANYDFADNALRSAAPVTVAEKNVISVEKISFSYGDKKIFDSVSELFDSRITCLMGRSGGGKTTFLRLLAGLIKPEAGYFKNVPERISMMFQEDRLFPWLNALENVSTVCDDSEKARSILKDLELEEHINKMPSELSGGMRRRVALARTLAYGGSLMILDEPFKGLDAALAGRVAGYIASSDADMIIVTTHDIRDAELLGAAVKTI